MSSESDAVPPRKRRRLDALSSEIVADVISDVDVEIALRERLAQSLQDRISWARILQENILKGDAVPLTTDQQAYRNAAFDAWNAIHAPCDIIFDRELPRTQWSNDGVHPPLRSPLTIPGPSRKAPLRSSALRAARVEIPQSFKPKFLYMRAPANTGPPSGFYILKCPICQRTSFTSLQGLLNHARIAHKLEWGTHDECIRGCAVPFSTDAASRDPSLPLTLDGGLEINGNSSVLPSLQRMFQIAVGDQNQNDDFHLVPTQLDISTQEPPEEHAHAPPILHSALQPTIFSDEISKDLDDHASQPQSQSTLISRTLGLHADTPDLAPFLGKTARRRQIGVWNEDEDVDIDTCKYDSWDTALMWSRRLRVVNEAQPLEQQPQAIAEEHLPLTASLLPFEPKIPPEPEATTVNARESDVLAVVNAQPGPMPSLAQGSRFHMIARVVVSDRSWWIPPEKRQDQDAPSHRWMISVEAPSYSLNLTTILHSLRVSLSEFQPFGVSVNPFDELTCFEPPFAIVGTATQSFLARIELDFNPVTGKGDEPQKVILEHWIELDPMKSLHPVPGEEQVVDAELDRQTIIGPIRKDVVSLASRAIWDRHNASRATSVVLNDHSPESMPDYEKILRELVLLFPLTAKGSQARTRNAHANVPYKLVASPSHFKSLVAGRRKAIEWGRASALRDAYMVEVRKRNIGLPELSIGDIFKWLEAKGFFIRDTDSQDASSGKHAIGDNKRQPDANANAAAWCARCGLPSTVHSSVNSTHLEKSDSNQVDAQAAGMDRRDDTPCPFVGIDPWRTELPMIDASLLIEHSQLSSSPRHPSDRLQFSRRWKPRDLVRAIDPSLILGVERVVRPLRLPTFDPAASFAEINDSSIPIDRIKVPTSPFPLDYFGTTKDEVDHKLAPHALLGATLKPFIRELVRGGLAVAKRDKERAIQLLMQSDQITIKEEDQSLAQSDVIDGSNPKLSRSQGGKAPTRRSGARGRKEIMGSTKMLTPGHILRGIVDRAFPAAASQSGRAMASKAHDPGLGQAIYLSLGRLGVPLDHTMDGVPKDAETVLVKEEEDG